MRQHRVSSLGRQLEFNYIIGTEKRCVGHPASPHPIKLCMADFDLTEGILGRYVPETAGTVSWDDGCKTILPAIYDRLDPAKNIFDGFDIPVVLFLAKQPRSDTGSLQVTHLPHDSLDSLDIAGTIGASLRQNKPVVIRNAGHGIAWIDLTADFLDVRYGISPDRHVCITGMGVHLCASAQDIHRGARYGRQGSCPHASIHIWHHRGVFRCHG